MYCVTGRRCLLLVRLALVCTSGGPFELEAITTERGFRSLGADNRPIIEDLKHKLLSSHLVLFATDIRRTISFLIRLDNDSPQGLHRLASF